MSDGNVSPGMLVVLTGLAAVYDPVRSADPGGRSSWFQARRL